MSSVKSTVAVAGSIPQEAAARLEKCWDVQRLPGEDGLRKLDGNNIVTLIISAGEASDDLPGLVSEYTLSHPHLKVIVVAPGLDDETARRALEAGAFDIFTEEPSSDDLFSGVRRAVSHYRICESGILTSPEKDESIIGSSSRIGEFLKKLEKVAVADVPVLIQGESGTGKELAALSIHGSSRRRHGPFAIINCGAIPETLLEAELFGYERGAFTGADVARKGKIEYASGGTLFLDEIGELSPRLQVKLLRFLQEKKIERLGGRSGITVDARIISATNRDIRAMTLTGAFREDLYFRLGVITLVSPPLRERGDDVLTLALYFLKKYAKDLKRPVQGFSQDAISAMKAYHWPGNIRELQNRIKGALALCGSRHINARDMMLGEEKDETGTERAAGFLEANTAFKKRLVQESLLKNKGVVTRAAKDLGISRQYLSRLISRFNISID